MKIGKLSVAHFRGLEQIDLEFEDDLTVIAGVNGVGKSACLDALAKLLSRALPEFTPSKSNPLYFANDDIQNGKDMLQAGILFAVSNLRLMSADIQYARSNDLLHAGVWKLLRLPILPLVKEGDKHKAENQAERTSTGDLDAGMEETRKLLMSLRTSPSPPLAIYFSTVRQLPGKPKTLPKVEPYKPQQAYEHALDGQDLTLRQFIHWFHTQEVLARDVDSRRGRVLDQLRQVVSDFIPEFRDLRMEELPELRFIVNKNGTEVTLNQLSDGEKGLLAIVFDITRRLAIANPELENPIVDGQAVILIDEIELHLHPAWQRSVLHRLRETFKQCQFIVTTHSPQILGEVEAKCVRFLKRDEDGKVICWKPKRALGLDASRILDEVMKVPSRNKGIAEKLDAISRLIDVGEYATAKEQIKQLEFVIGENDSDLTHAKTLIAFLEDEE